MPTLPAVPPTLALLAAYGVGLCATALALRVQQEAAAPASLWAAALLAAWMVTPLARDARRAARGLRLAAAVTAVAIATLIFSLWASGRGALNAVEHDAAALLAGAWVIGAWALAGILAGRVEADGWGAAGLVALLPLLALWAAPLGLFALGLGAVALTSLAGDTGPPARRLQATPSPLAQRSGLSALEGGFGAATALLVLPHWAAPLALAALVGGSASKLAESLAAAFARAQAGTPVSALHDLNEPLAQRRSMRLHLDIGLTCLLATETPRVWAGATGAPVEGLLALAVAATAGSRLSPISGLWSALAQVSAGVVGGLVAGPPGGVVGLSVGAAALAGLRAALRQRRTGDVAASPALLASLPALTLCIGLTFARAPRSPAEALMEVAAIVIVHAIAGVAAHHLGAARPPPQA